MAMRVRKNPFRSPPRVLISSLAVLALVLAGCGGEEDPAEEPVEEPAEEPAAEEPAEEPAAEEPAEEPVEEPAAEGAADGSQEMSAEELPTLTLANQENLFGLAALVAEERGYFEEQGVTVEQVFNPSGAERSALVIGGTADASILGVGSGMRGFVNDDWHFVGTMVQAGGANALACAPDRGIESVADLQGSGMPIATAEGSGTTLTFQHFIAPEFGVTDDDWEIVNLPTSDRLSAVASGAAGCMLNQEPILTQAEDAGLAEIVEDGVYLPYDPSHQVLYVSTSFLEQEGGEEAVVRFLAALQDAAGWIQENQQEAAQLYIDAMGERGIDVGDEQDVIEIGVEKQGYQVCIGEDFRNQLQAWGEIQVENGELPDMPNFDEMVEWELNERATGGC